MNSQKHKDLGKDKENKTCIRYKLYTDTQTCPHGGSIHADISQLADSG